MRILKLSRLNRKTYGTRRAIARTQGNMRLLSCGDWVKAPRGGKTRDAKFALCKNCLQCELLNVRLKRSLAEARSFES